MSKHVLKEKCNEMRKVIENGCMNFRMSGNGDGGTVEDDHDVEDDDNFTLLDSAANSVFKEKKEISKKSSLTTHSSDFFRMRSVTLLYFILMQFDVAY